MTAFRTCVGCHLHGLQCEARDGLKAALAGLSITSVKWRCKSRRPMFAPGDPVWARTVADYGDETTRDDFPATIIRLLGTSALVFISQGSESRGGYIFETSGNGFCKLPLSRLFERDGAKETLCRYCDAPASHGHIPGYSCSMEFGPALSQEGE